MSAERFECTPWCADGDGHRDYFFRGDQSCWGPAHKTVIGLDPHAPALPFERIPEDAPAISVYAYQGYYQLPKVKLHVYWDTGNEHTSLDDNVALTPFEAIELANHLIAVVEEIGGVK